jgi:A/G-specific adenine glycosylase
MTLGSLKQLAGNVISASRFRHKLLRWFDRHKRDLPWRQDRDPYRVWLSEIMLQQTRVAAAVEHYKGFLRRFPTLEKLAAARQSSAMAAWSGLGYYRRARMLHAAAREIVYQHSGKFPMTADDLRMLPGIGRYTSAAIASIAFGEPVAAVDGNVERVLQRVLGKQISGERLWRISEELLARKRPGDFNQAMMELGATVCLPRRPKCPFCPVSKICATRGDLGSARQPVRQRKREIHYAFDCRNRSVFLVKRSKTATLMPGMWELPEISSTTGSGDAWLTLRHSITVTDYIVRVEQCHLPARTEGYWVAKSRVARLPLTGLARKILRAAKVI